MGLIYTSYQTPARFQLGDLVEGTNISGATLQGTVVNFVNRDPRLLNEGRVEIHISKGSVPDTQGSKAWITATKVIKTAGDLQHPLLSITPETKYEWACQCGQTGTANTASAAQTQHRTHQHRS